MNGAIADAKHILDPARQRPTVVGIGGTLSPRSTSETALRYALAHAESFGARVELITAAELQLPLYDWGIVDDVPQARRMLDLLAAADHVVISSPGYHAGMSGLLKNALDYLEELAADDRPYLHGRSVGCIAAAAGWQAGAATLGAVRATVHALRGWPTPLGVVINSSVCKFDENGRPTDAKVASQLELMVEQLISFRSTALAGV